MLRRDAGGKQQQLVQELQSQMAQKQAQLDLKDASNKKYKVCWTFPFLHGSCTFPPFPMPLHKRPLEPLPLPTASGLSSWVLLSLAWGQRFVKTLPLLSMPFHRQLIPTHCKIPWYLSMRLAGMVVAFPLANLPRGSVQDAVSKWLSSPLVVVLKLKVSWGIAQDAVRALRARLGSAAAALEQSEQKAHRLEASLVQQSPVRPSRQLQQAQAQLAMSEQRMEVWIHSPKGFLQPALPQLIAGAHFNIGKGGITDAQPKGHTGWVVLMSTMHKATKTCGRMPPKQIQVVFAGIAKAAKGGVQTWELIHMCMPNQTCNQQGFTDTCNWVGWTICSTFGNL